MVTGGFARRGFPSALAGLFCDSVSPKDAGVNSKSEPGSVASDLRVPIKIRKVKKMRTHKYLS